MSEVIYIPGLGGRRSILLQKSWVHALNAFRRPSRRIRFFDPEWETNEQYSDKFDRLNRYYDALGRPDNIWAISAGASLAVRLCVQTNATSQLHIVCGKVYGPESIGDHYRRRAPAFVESVAMSSELADNLDTDQVSCYVPAKDADGVITTKDMTVPGANVVDLPPLKHARAISYALARYLPRL